MQKQEIIKLNISGHVLITDQDGNTLYDDHNEVQPETAWILLKSLSGVPLSHLGIGVGKITCFYGSSYSKLISEVDLASMASEITFKALIPHDAFSGEITELSLQSGENLNFSILPDISIHKGINTALLISWKIKFGIV